jgi:hypothetical protein
MRSGWRMAALGLLLALLAGCNRKQPNVTLPVTAQAPSRSVWQMAEDLTPPMPPLPPYLSQTVMLDTSVPPEPAPTVAETHPKRTHRRTKPEVAPQEAPKSATQGPEPAESTEVASNIEPSDSSPIGQLSTASGDKNTGDRQALLDKINAMENQLNGIHRSFTSDEEKTVTLIRTFISRARDALKTDDLDGAQNYYTKGKILLQELTTTP